MNFASTSLLTTTPMEVDRLLSPQWVALIAPLADRVVPSEDRILYTFRLFDFDLRLTVISYDQEPALIGLLAHLRPTGAVGKSMAIVNAPVEGGWSLVASDKISDTPSLEAALARLARQVENQPQIITRRSKQMSHRIGLRP